jgi:uncharacterized membrane protein
MQHPTLHLGQAISIAWQAIKRYPGPTIGGFLLYGVILLGVGFVPLVGALAGIVLAPPLYGGLLILYLSVLDGRNPQIGDLFAGFRAFGKWMGIYWLLYAIILGTMVPLAAVAIPMAITSSRHQPSLPPAAVPALAGGIAAAAIAYLAGLAWLVIRWWFVYWVGVERAGVIEAFRHSAEITRGRRLQLFWFLLLLSLLSVSGVLALGLGLIVTLPLCWLAQVALYRQLSPLAPPPLEAPAPAPDIPPALPEVPEVPASTGEESLP